LLKRVAWAQGAGGACVRRRRQQRAGGRRCSRIAGAARTRALPSLLRRAESELACFGGSGACVGGRGACIACGGGGAAGRRGERARGCRSRQPRPRRAGDTDAVAMAAAERRVYVHRNEAGAEPQVMTLGREDFKKFKKAAGKKVRVRCKKVFLSTGVEITDVDEIRAEDRLYVSDGEAFYKAAPGASTETLHVAVLGAGSVGKSALTLRFVRDFFIKDWDPTIEDAYRKTVNVDGATCQLEILDTAGQDDFESLRPQWMMDKDGYIFVYAMDRAGSAETDLRPFFELHTQINEARDVPVVLVANKKDIVDNDPGKREVTEERGRELAREFGGARYVETSAFSGENVAEAFHTVVREVRERRKPKAAADEPRRFFCTLL